VQMGWHRGGWYTARWVDRLLFPANGPSATAIDPALQELQVGDFIPDGPPQTHYGLFVEAIEPERALVQHSNSHLPISWRRRHVAELDWSWAFVLRPLDDGGRTHFHFRSRWWTSPWWLTLGGRLVVSTCGLCDVARDVAGSTPTGRANDRGPAGRGLRHFR
jgi:hypothetical protein